MWRRGSPAWNEACLVIVKLHFSGSHSPRNVALSLCQGDPVYKVTTPFKVTDRISTIHRLAKKNGAHSGGDPKHANHDVKIAEIEWQMIKPCRLKFVGRDIGVDKYFRKAGPRWGRRDRVFLAPDDREYVWKFKGPVLELYPNDDHSILVATFHPSTLGRRGPASQLSVLIIFPEWEHLADTIVATFVYVESLRNS